jgi:hypothetical protein
MPTINGQFTITFTANEAANTVDYLISGAAVASGTVSVNCTGVPPAAPCSVTLPVVTYDDPSCDEITIEVTIYSDCDPDNSVTKTQTFNFNQGCITYALKCNKNPEGCEAFNTTAICPSCDPLPSSSAINIDSLGTVNSLVSPPINALRDFIPYNSTFYFCYDDVTRIAQELNPNDWTIEPYPEGCCWECRMYSFIFSPLELSYSTPNNPPFPPGVRGLPDVFPMVVGTECDDETNCYRPYRKVIDPSGYIVPIIEPIQVCMRVNSYTIVGNKYPVTVTDMGPCGI